MTNRKIGYGAVTAAVMALTCAASASAQTPAASVATVAPGSTASARKLIDLMGVERQFDLMFVQLMPLMTGNIVQALAKDGPPAIHKELETEEGKARINGILGEEIMKSLRARYGDLKKNAAREYAAIFSESELQGLITFYGSPLGAKTLKALPELQQKLSAAGRDIGMVAGMEAVPRAMERIAGSRPLPKS